MKAVLSPVPEHVLEWRKRTGADRYDEMWEGVLHMGPVPTEDHDDLRWALETYLRLRWARGREAKVRCMNVAPPGGWPADYRLPDLIVWTRDRESMNKRTHFEGPPLVAIEIRSPDDESYEKLPFYARLGVPEVWVIDRDSKAIDLFALVGHEYNKTTAGPDGWFASAATGLQMRPSGAGSLLIRLGTDDPSREEIPHD